MATRSITIEINGDGNLEAKIKDIDDSVRGLGDSTDEAGRGIAGMGDKIREFAERAASVFTGVALADAARSLGDKVVEAFGDALSTEPLNDKLAAQLGLNATESERYGRLAGDLYSDAYGEGIGDVNDALRSVTQNIGGMADASDAEMERVTAGVLNLATTFEQDLGGTSRAVGQMIRTGLAKDATEALDILARGFQTGADRAEDLLDTYNEYPTVFRDLGLSGRESMGLISQAMATGARDSDLAADALKEFSIRAKDASESSKEGFEALGLDAEKMTAIFARGGRGAAEGLDLVLDRLRNMEDPVARNAAAVALFGTQAEDLAQALFAMDPSEAVKALGQVDGAATRLGDTLNDNLMTKIESLKRSGIKALSDLINHQLFPALNSIADAAGPAFAGIGRWASENTALLRLMATAGLVYVAAQVGAVAVELGRLAATSALTTVVTQVRALTEWLTYARAAYVQVAAAQGTMTATSQVLTYALTSKVAALALVTAAVYGVSTAFDEGRRKGEEFVSALSKQTDRSNLQSLQIELRTVGNELDGLLERGTNVGDMAYAFVDWVIPIHNLEGSIIDTKGEIDALNQRQEELRRQTEQANAAIWEMANAMSPLRQAAQDAGQQGIGVLSGEAVRLKQQQVAGEVQGIHDRLVALAAAEKIDLTQPGAVDKLRELADRTAITSTSVLGMRDAVAQYRDVAGDAATKTDAYKAALDALMGAHVNSWNAATSAAEAIKGLSEATLRGAGMFDLNTQSAVLNNAEVFKNQRALSGAVDAARQHAQAVFEETNSVQQASATLGTHREDLLNVMTQLLGNRAAAEAYINQLGLTPDAVRTFLDLQNQQANERLSGSQGKVNQLGRGTTVPISANTAAFDAAVARSRANLSLLSPFLGGQVPQADGGITLHQYARGGFRERHIAQIARPGAWRVWAEPETGGEAYIPLAPHKRDRSLAILAQVADMFGYGLLPASSAQFGAGGLQAAALARHVETVVGAQGRSTGGYQRKSTGDVAPSVEVHLHVTGAVVADEEALGRAVTRGLQAAGRAGVRMPWTR